MTLLIAAALAPTKVSKNNHVRLTKEEHKALGIELHCIQHRIAGVGELLRQRYGPDNSTTLSAAEAQSSVQNLIRKLLTQALVADYPDDPDPLMFY